MWHNQLFGIMKMFYSVLLQVLGAGLAASILGAVAAHIQLQFYIDYERVKKETGHPGWKILGSVLAPAEFYKSEAKLIWRIRRIGFISVVTFIILLLIAGVLAERAGFSIPIK
jgi:hypothetical protein